MSTSSLTPRTSPVLKSNRWTMKLKPLTGASQWLLILISRPHLSTMSTKTVWSCKTKSQTPKIWPTSSLGLQNLIVGAKWKHSMVTAGQADLLTSTFWMKMRRTTGDSSSAMKTSKDRTTFTISGMIWMSHLSLTLTHTRCHSICCTGKLMAALSNTETSITHTVLYIKRAHTVASWSETMTRDAHSF